MLFYFNNTIRDNVEVNKIYKQSCIDTIGSIDDEFIDITITSPPYNADIQYDSYDDRKPFDQYKLFTSDYLNGLYRITKIGGRLCINVNNTLKIWEEDRIVSFATFITTLAESAGWVFREQITWIKMKDESGDIFAGGKTAWGSWLSASNPHLRSFTEPILIFHKVSDKKEPVGISDITKQEFMDWTKNAWYIMPSKNEFHPAVYPKEIPRRLIKLYSYVDDIVYDPFAGSGTTLVTAKELKRRFLGSEISDKYYYEANLILSQMDLF